MRVSRLVVGALVALVVGGVLAAGAVTADAKRCALWDGDAEVGPDECYYTNDANGPISVYTIAGTVNGGNGDDEAQWVEGDGVFNGGGGRDQAGFVIENATFNGGAGSDGVGGYVNGSGTFNGGTGDDRMAGSVLSGGTFNGGPGDDSLAFMCGGTFSGGPGNDTVDEYDDGVVWSATIDNDSFVCAG